MGKLYFVWQGVTARKDHWRDGLWAAMQILEQQYDVTYAEPWDEIPEDAFVLHWEAPCTVNGQNAPHYNRIHQLPNKKILLFAGGPLKREWVKNYDCVVVESQINEQECADLGIPYDRAFGINTDIFKPLVTQRRYDAVAHGTCASWKRQWLLCQALGHKAVVFGAYQDTDSRPFDECEKCESMVLHEQSYEDANRLLNTAWVSVNCADFWGGGQRATLEAMACNLPVVVMKDSPKNIEFVQECGLGEIVDPEPHHIKAAVERLKGNVGGRDYVLSKWTHHHYADNLRRIINTYA